MTVRAQFGQMTVNADALRAYAASPTGPILRDLMRRGTNVQLVARRLVRKRTRKLERSIVKRAAVDGRGPVVYVLTDVDYGIHEHDGTRPHVILPRHRRVLRFPVATGEIVFAARVNHPGTTGTFFLTRALPAARD